LGWPLAARGNDSDLVEIQTIMDRLLESAADHPGNGYWQYHKSVALQSQGKADAASLLLENAVKKHSELAWAWMQLASCWASTGDYDRARTASDKAGAINDKLTPAHFAECIRAMSHNERIVATPLDGLVAAGLIGD